MILKMAAVVKVQYSIIFCKDIFTALLSLSIFKHMFLASSYQFSLICPRTLHNKPTVVTNDDICLQLFFRHWDIHKSSPMLWYVTGEGEKTYHPHFHPTVNNTRKKHPKPYTSSSRLWVSFTDSGHPAPAKPFLYITRKILRADHFLSFT